MIRFEFDGQRYGIGFQHHRPGQPKEANPRAPWTDGPWTEATLYVITDGKADPVGSALARCSARDVWNPAVGRVQALTMLLRPYSIGREKAVASAMRLRRPAYQSLTRKEREGFRRSVRYEWARQGKLADGSPSPGVARDWPRGLRQAAWAAYRASGAGFPA